MSTTDTAKESYTYQRPSTAATRALVDDSATAPTTTTSTSTSEPEYASASSNDVEVAQKPTLQRKTTDNYERAAAEATKAGTLGTAVDSTSESDASIMRPGVQRQQSWQMRDFKGAYQGQMLTRDVGHGYSSTGK